MDKALIIEGIKINQSLTVLGRVLSASIENQNHIPFRESVLTKLLKRPLIEGECLVICCISGLIKDIFQSHNTMQFGKRACLIIRKEKDKKNNK